MSKVVRLEVVMATVDRLSQPLRQAVNSVRGGSDSLLVLRQRLQQLNRSQKDLNVFQALKKQSIQTGEAFQQAQEKTQQLALRLKQTKQPSQQLIQQFKQARLATRDLKQQQYQQIRSLDQLRNRLQQAGYASQNLVSAQRRIQQAIQATNAKVQHQVRAMQQLQDKQQRLARMKVSHDRTMQLASHTAVTGQSAMHLGQRASHAMQQPANVAISFEKSMSKVKALTRLYTTQSDSEDNKQYKQKQFTQLRQQALDLGSSTSFSASQAASAQSFLAMAGFKPKAIVRSMPGMLDLAKAGDMGLARTADISSNILSGFGMNKDPATLGQEMKRLGDVMAYTFTTSNVDMSMLGETMKYVAPIASKAGASVEEVAAMAGMLGDVGIQGSMAGTTLRSAFLRLADAPKPAMKALKRLGVHTKTANGEMRPMLAVLENLRDQMAHLENGEQIELISTIFGAEAASGMTELMSNIDQLQAKHHAIQTKSADTAKTIAQTMGQNTAGKLKAMRSAMEGLQITLGDKLKPSLDRTIASVTRFIQMTQKWINNHSDLTQKIANVAFAGAKLITVGGALLAGMAALLGPFALLRFGIQRLGLGMLSTSKQGGLLLKALSLLKAFTGFAVLGVGIQALSPKIQQVREQWEGLVKQLKLSSLSLAKSLNQPKRLMTQQAMNPLAQPQGSKLLNWATQSQPANQSQELGKANRLGILNQQLLNLPAFDIKTSPWTNLQQVIQQTTTHALPQLGNLRRRFLQTFGVMMDWVNHNRPKLRRLFEQTFSRISQVAQRALQGIDHAFQRTHVTAWLDQLFMKTPAVMQGLLDFGRGMAQVVMRVVRATRAVADFLGGWDKLGMLVMGLVILGKLASVLGALSSVLAIIGFLATPVGVVVAAVIALGLAGIYLYQNWNKVTNYLNQTQWGQALLWVIEKVSHALSWLAQKASDVGWSNLLAHALKGLLMPFRLVAWVVEKVGKVMDSLLAIWEKLKQSFAQTSWGKVILGVIEQVASGFDWAKNRISAFKSWWDSWSLTGKTASVNVKTPKASAITTSVSGGYISAKDQVGMPKLAGARAMGGSVKGGSFYRVNERGPELLTMSGKTYLMASQQGHVSPVMQSLSNMPASVKHVLQQPAMNDPMIKAAVQPIPVRSGKSQTINPSPSSTTVAPMTVNITIHAQAGQDANAVARQVRQELANLQRQQERRQRARLSDEVA